MQITDLSSTFSHGRGGQRGTGGGAMQSKDSLRNPFLIRYT